MQAISKKMWIIAILATLAVASTAAMAEKPANDWLANATETEAEIMQAGPQSRQSDPVVEPAGGWQKPIPITLSLDYTYVSHYMWRGQDLTPDHNRCNHQMTVGLEYDLGDFGAVGFSFWGTFNRGHEVKGCAQELDYTIYYTYSIEPIGLDTEIGFIWYTFPHLHLNDTQEIYFSLGWDDGILWRALGLNCGAILNPYYAMYFDVDEARGGVWGEFGFSHDFAFADYGMDNTPVLKDMTFGLSWMMGWASDYAWTDFYSGPMTMGYGMALTLDLKSMMNVPDCYASDIYLTGFLNWNQALTNNWEAAALTKCQPWGGVSIGYAW